MLDRPLTYKLSLSNEMSLNRIIPKVINIPPHIRPIIGKKIELLIIAKSGNEITHNSIAKYIILRFRVKTIDNCILVFILSNIKLKLLKK